MRKDFTRRDNEPNSPIPHQSLTILSIMLHYIADYGVLICSIYGYAIQNLDSHLKRLYEMKAPEWMALV